ncbi:MAG: SpoIIE family protein phosphatase [Candidatus Geothermincolia bacterium]
MDDKPVGTRETIAFTGAPESKALRHEVAEFLRANMDRMITEMDAEVESAVPGFDSLPHDALADMRRSFRDLYQLYEDYFEATELPRKLIKNLATDIGRRWAGQGMQLSMVIGSFDTGETYLWETITRELLPKGYPAGAWVDLASMRDNFTKRVRHYMRRAYRGEEQSTVARQLEEFRALAQLGQVIVSTVDLERVLRQILEVATSLMQSRLGAIMLLDVAGGNLEVVADMGLSRAWVTRERIPLEKSLAGVSIKRNEYVLARDDELAEFELPRPAVGRKIRTALSIPITVDEEPIGVIELYETTPRVYTDLDITMLTTLGPQAGVAIKNARLFREERRQRRQAAMLTEFTQSISEARDLDELLETIAAKTAQALGVDRCSLFFYEPEANALTFMAGYGRSTLQVWLLNQFHVPMSELGQATARALRNKEPVMVEEVGEEISLESRIFRGPGVRSYLQVPLVVKDELVGLMSLEFTNEEVNFTEDATTLANSLGRQAAVAIQNRRLQERLFDQQMTIRNAEINERLYRERERSEAVLRATPDAVLVIDKENKIVLVNPAAEFLTGWSQDDARGRNCHEVLYGAETAPGICPGPECPISRMFSGEHVAYSEDELVTRSGRRIPVGGTFAPIIAPDGRIENVVAIYRDISEQKELEKYALIQREMEIASGIQTSLLPRAKLQAGNIRVHARQQQARIVGGDWFDYWHNEDKVFLVVGDASGQGVGAALFATMAMSALRVEAREHNKILEIMEHVNRSLYQGNRSDSFVTVFFSVIDIPTMTISYTNAGHEEPLTLGLEKTLKPLTSTNRSLLGIFSRANLDVQRHKLEEGDRIVMFTDGVIDAKNSRGKLFGLRRLNRFITANKEKSPEEFIDSLIENVLEFCGGELKDDMTVLVCDIEQTPE